MTISIDDILDVSTLEQQIRNLYAPPTPVVKNAITEHFTLPEGADHTDYRIVVISGEEICVHKDFVDFLITL